MAKNHRIQDKVVLITGGGRGIGRETALHFAKQGAKVAITDVDDESLASTLEKIRAVSRDALALRADVTSPEDARRTVAEIMERFGRLDALINNAGISARGTFQETSFEVFASVVRVNFLGAANMTKAALEPLKQSRGSIIFISSIAGMKGIPGALAYGSSKGVLKVFSEGLRSELMGDHVHVGLIYLGFTQNDTDKTFFKGDGEAVVLRPYRFSHTQVQIAEELLQMIVKRRRLRVLSLLGKAARLAYLLLPRFSEVALSRRALKTQMYKTES